MKYDFTSVIDRTGKDSIAWENIPVPNAEIAEGFDRIPMWVADMNFQTAPSVCEAITKRLEHQVFGYFDPSEEYYNSIINWQIPYFLSAQLSAHPPIPDHPYCRHRSVRAWKKCSYCYNETARSACSSDLEDTGCIQYDRNRSVRQD